MKRAFALLLASTMFILTACSTSPSAKSESMQIVRGMDYNSVLDIAAPFPKERTFKGRGTALQFCSKGFGDDSGQYVVVWLVDDLVEGLTQYTASLGSWGCSKRFREIDWGQAPADVKIKLDID